jgi:hypothetical protein
VRWWSWVHSSIDHRHSAPEPGSVDRVQVTNRSQSRAPQASCPGETSSRFVPSPPTRGASHRARGGRAPRYRLCCDRDPRTVVRPHRQGLPWVGGTTTARRGPAR